MWCLHVEPTPGTSLVIQRSGICTPLLGAQIQSLVGELRSHKHHGTTKKRKKKSRLLLPRQYTFAPQKDPGTRRSASSFHLHECEVASVVSDSATLWTGACQAPLSTGFSRKEYWSGLACFPSGDLPDTGIKPASLISPALAGGFFIISATWEALVQLSPMH